jgi:phosphatidylglycerol:prolipoprotein diacylglycerol transferase
VVIQSRYFRELKGLEELRPARFRIGNSPGEPGEKKRQGQASLLSGIHRVYSFAVIPFLHLGPLTVPTFGLMVATAMVCAYFALRADIRRRRLAPDQDSAAAMAEAFVAFPCLAGIVGAKLYHELQSPREFFAHPLQQIISPYGFAWFGGLLAGFAAYAWLAWMRKIPLLEMFDAGSPAAALGYGIGRIGCLLSGDGDYGIPTTLPWGMSFPNGLVPTTERVHPTPVYELIAACAITWWLWRYGAKQIAARSVRPTHSPAAQRGVVFAAYLVLTGVERFLVEFIRINPRSFLGMSNAQAAGLLSTIAGAATWWYLTQKQNSLTAPDVVNRSDKSR